MSLRLVSIAILCAFAVSGCRHLSLGEEPIGTQLESASVEPGNSLKDVGAVSALPASITVDTPYPTRLSKTAERHLELQDIDVQEASNHPEQRYLLDTGDRVRVFVYGQPNLSREYSVDDSGAVSIPLLGPITARGLSTQDLEGLISARLRIEYVRDPHVNVEVSTYRPFFILGEVRNPGQYPYLNRMTAEMAVAIAGGYTGRASKRDVRIIRHLNGKSQRIDAPAHIRVQPGDTITVKERFF